MDLITEFLRRLSSELAPFRKWAISHWPIIVICLIVAFLLEKNRKKRKF